MKTTYKLFNVPDNSFLISEPIERALALRLHVMMQDGIRKIFKDIKDDPEASKEFKEYMASISMLTYDLHADVMRIPSITVEYTKQ